MKYFFFWCVGLLCAFPLWSQPQEEKVSMKSIGSVQFFLQNNPTTLPIIELNATSVLELHFDEWGKVPRNFFYTFLLCNADWSPAQLTPFDYIRGFQQNRIGQYRVSSLTRTPYVHYQANLPERSALPSRSGNYLLVVYADGDPQKIAFTKRFWVVDNQLTVFAQVQEPFDISKARTHQKIQFEVNAAKLSLASPRQISVTVLQNGRWDNARTGLQPSFIRGNQLAFNPESETVFPAGKEYRWLDFQSFRFLSDRMADIDRTQDPVLVAVKPDQARGSLRYAYFRDFNGYTQMGTTDAPNPWWQGDYGWVVFNFVPANGKAFPDKDVFLLGALSGNLLNDSTKMQWNSEKMVYQKSLLLKQGYYNYCYATGKPGLPGESQWTEGDHWETENEYHLFVYYRSLGGRHDELLAVKTINSLRDRLPR